ncbi:GNAT family N-acetyltransferase [Thermomonospora cellulosilytica]|uniref:RimJ/RimL family protein N-acetyltransferase n=1 Tax=Thermomonospora cellulosilytica TaxID=1411118 RepID=A0A7W3MZW9_9ACTN|nr:GNAT family N-acetyltransferase [Thermomonospora cellulosilytica]MBA9004959.1 RimJ/RimL family protein N-acetyltransferase [Thermomonospora cellulosilytica]
MRTLTTRRLLLEPWQERHAPDLLRLATDIRVMRHIGTGVWTPGYAARRHVRALRHWADHGFGWRAVHDRADRSFLGLVSLIRPAGPVAGVPEPALEIGWWVAPHAWGRGIATEAASAVLAEAFGRLGAAAVVARFQVANTGSARVTAKLGLVPVAEAAGPDGEPMRICALTGAEYRRHRPAGDDPENPE